MRSRQNRANTRIILIRAHARILIQVNFIHFLKKNDVGYMPIGNAKSVQILNLFINKFVRRSHLEGYLLYLSYEDAIRYRLPSALIELRPTRVLTIMVQVICTGCTL